MIYAAYVPGREDLVAEQAFRIAWEYLVRCGYEDCVPHQVAVVGYINEQIEHGVRHKLVLANKAITAFQAARERDKAEFAGEAWGQSA
jgi:hypothetical protein